MKNKVIFRIVSIPMIVAVMAVCSWISIPMAIPFTLQTFAIFLALLLLGGRNALIAILVYLTIGAIGVPVFSGFTGGFSHIIGPTGGYMVGFIFMAIIYMIFELIFKKRNHVYYKVIALVIGLIVCYLFGTIWFMIINHSDTITFKYVLSVCVIPFILPDLAKMVIAVILSFSIKKLVKSIR